MSLTLEVLGVLILLYIAAVLTGIAGKLAQEADRRRRYEDESWRSWFRHTGRYLQEADRCSCSENGPCMAHWGAWLRWRYGATEAIAIAEEMDARMPEFAEILAEKVALRLKGEDR